MQTAACTPLYPPSICPVYVDQSAGQLQGQLQGARIQLPLTVGFVWSATHTAPTLARNDGASVPRQVTGSADTGLAEFVFTLPASVSAGTYYVRAYVVWPASNHESVTYSRAGTTFTVV